MGRFGAGFWQWGCVEKGKGKHVSGCTASVLILCVKKLAFVSLAASLNQRSRSFQNQCHIQDNPQTTILALSIWMAVKKCLLSHVFFMCCLSVIKMQQKKNTTVHMKSYDRVFFLPHCMGCGGRNLRHTHISKYEHIRPRLFVQIDTTKCKNVSSFNKFTKEAKSGTVKSSSVCFPSCEQRATSDRFKQMYAREGDW